MSDRRALAQRLAVVAGFDDPSARLEQYRTPPELAAHIVHLADLRDDVAGRTVVDLGAGTGMLALGAALCGPDRVVGVELDAAALSTARDNAVRVGSATDLGWVRADVGRLPLSPAEPTTVLSNPPFGAVDGREGADRQFLAAAAAVADVSYTVHNAGSREFVEAFAADNGGTVTDAYAADFEVTDRFDHHTSDVETVAVEVFRTEWDRNRIPGRGP
ncbi:MAG: METTL5 family protein [Halolamina sp.]